jgi:hypothetical protein
MVKIQISIIFSGKQEIIHLGGPAPRHIMEAAKNGTTIIHIPDKKRFLNKRVSRLRMFLGSRAD